MNYYELTIEQANKMSRLQLIDYLCWNDRNGIYTDKDSIAEGLEPMTRELALEHVLRSIDNAQSSTL